MARVKTAYIETQLSYRDGKSRILLPASGQTFVCAPKWHGRSALMYSLAHHLSVVSECAGGGPVLYYSLHFPYIFVQERLAEMGNCPKCTRMHYAYSTDRMVVKSPVLKAAGIVRTITEDVSRHHPFAVFIDSLNNIETGRDRRGDLIRTAQRLKALAEKKKVPIVTSLRLDTRACSPCDLETEYIDEAELEPFAECVIMLWNSKFSPTKITSWFKGDARNRMLERGLYPGTPGQMYVRAVKGVDCGADGVYPIIGSSYISGVERER